MRIALLDEYFVPDSPGGAEWSVYYLARAVAAKGHAVRILTPDLSTRDEREEVSRIERTLAESGDAKVVRFAFSRTLGEPKRAFPSYVFGNPFFHRKFNAEIIRCDRAESFDILHAQGLDSFAPAASAAAKTRRPCVATVRDYRALCPISICLHDNERAPAGCTEHDFRACLKVYLEQYGVKNSFAGRVRHDLRRRLEWRNSRCAGRSLKSMDGAIFVSQRILDIYRDADLAPRRSAVIHNIPPIPIEPSDASLLAARLNLVGRRVLAFIGRYSLGKGAKVLAEAMAIIGRRRSDVVCVAAGNREYAGGASNIIFAGRLSPAEVRALYALSEAAVAPSRWQEPLSRVLLEAMQAGLPVIASDTGGNAEMVQNGVTGLLVRRNDPDALAEAINKFLDLSSADREKMGRAAKEMQEKNFRADDIADEVLEFYRTVIAETGKNA